jgi:hypothetical protein
MRTIQQIKQDRDLLFTLIRVYREAIEDPDVFRDVYGVRMGLCRSIRSYTYKGRSCLINKIYKITHSSTNILFDLPLFAKDHTTLRNSFEVRLELLHDLLRENREEGDELEGDE